MKISNNDRSKIIDNVIQGPWNNVIDVPKNDVDPSEIDNVYVAKFKPIIEESGTMDVQNIKTCEYEKNVSEKNLEDFRKAKYAIQLINEQLFQMMMPILFGLNSKKIEILKFNDIRHIVESVKKLDAIYALVKSLLHTDNINEFKRDNFYYPIYYIYERICQEVEMEKN